MTTLQHVELGVLGPLQVRQYGLPVAIPGAKPRAILTMLGLHGASVVPADTLLELLWGDDPPRTAVKALQTHISALRRALGDGFVLTEGAGWRLGPAEIDATRYKSAASAGRDAIATGDATAAVARFDEALSLWRGVPELPEGRRGLSEKTRWLEGHAALVEDRADALLATGRAAEIIGELEAAIADAPLRERRWGHLMLALYRAGRQGEALGAYQRARSLLADELGVDPGPDLRRLEVAIVTQDVSLELPVSHQLSAVTRAVTFLLTDIEGSTAAWEADADAMAIALARHDEIVEQVVTSRGGRLIKTRGEGDATFSVFDRPSGAAAAAIELQEAIRHEPWALAEPMRVRIALHTGEVEFRDGDYFGRAVNRAARLRSLALGGQILCSGATAELVIDSLSDDVILADLGKRQLKNLARPEHVFELRLESADYSRPATPEPPLERPALPTVLASPGPFVGRGLELERLMSAWQSTLTVGTHAVLIAGEPGVGKTRLAGEWSRRTYGEGAVVLYGRCDEDLGAPYQPFAEALRSLVPSLGTNRLRGLRGIEALLAMVPGLTDTLPDLTTPPRADADTERYALFDAVVALLGVASASAPVILVLDDLHWAAKPTLLLMRHLLRFGEQARVQIVGTYRSTDLDRSHPLAAMLADLHRDGSADRLTLGGLNEDDVTAYVAEAGYDDEELGRALASVTGGNPFFLIEALRHVDESGGKWDPSTLPQGVREAVSRRLSRLPAETNKALAAAAVVGSRFAVDLVERVMGQDLIDAFDEAAKAGILIEEPGGRYRFNHALVRQSLLTELASVRRMRLHHKIAAALENEPGADDEMLSDLAYHYFECAWAGNAFKAVEYCRRAGDQAMSRLAYEGAADLYDKALHALEEIDEDLPDRDDLKAELLIAHCEALLAAGDVGSAMGAVAQLQSAAGDSVRLAAWGTCFGGQLSMLTDPERLDDIEVAVGAAAEKLAGLGDAAGEAKAHTVRAGCLARLGRIGDCETALDQALTAARQARDHRRVNAVLAGAPIAALWGPNPVPRAGGRCLDVVRLLRITTGSPVVEATSTRCQGVLDAFRGRAAAGRQLIDSARRTLTELGMRHALLEVDQFAGIVELVADDPAAAENYLRRAYKGFRRMGLDADTADTAALLARACLALGKDAEADELCSEGERLAGHALKPSIAWRTVRAQLLARRGDHDGAKRVAEEAVAIAERTDELVDHGDACLALATVLDAAGDVAGARIAAEQALDLYERKGAAALAEKVRGLLSIEHPAAAPLPTPEPPIELANACVAVIEQTHAAFDRGAWDECSQFFAPDISVESRRKVVGFTPEDLRPGEWPRVARHLREGWTWQRNPVVAVRGERLALTRIELGTDDVSTGAPHEEFLALWGLDNNGRIAIQMFFDVDDTDAAVAELDARNVRYEQERPLTPTGDSNNACLRAVEWLAAAIDREAWDEVEQLFAPTTSVESRRKVVGFPRIDLGSRKWRREIRRYLVDMPLGEYAVIATRDDRLALFKLQTRAEDRSPGAPQDEVLELIGLDANGRIKHQIWFDVEDIDAAMAELETQHARMAIDNICVQTIRRMEAVLDREHRDEFFQMYAPDVVVESRRKIVGFGAGDIPSSDWPRETKRLLEVGGSHRIEVIAVRGDRFALSRLELGTPDTSPGAPVDESLLLVGLDDEGRIALQISFEIENIDAAMAELEAQHARLESARPALENAATRADDRAYALFAEGRVDEIGALYADDYSLEDRRQGLRHKSHDRATALNNVRAIADIGVINTHAAIGVRGNRLCLSHVRFEAHERGSGAFSAETLEINEVDADGVMIARVVFDADDLDGAYAELEARYLAGEAAPHAQVWSVVLDAFAAFAHRETPAATPDWINIDHRRGTRLAHSDLTAIVSTLNDIAPDLVNRIETVHRLGDHGALFTQVSRGTSQEGFDAEWRIVNLMMVEHGMVSRCELFDEADMETALARFDKLSRPTRNLNNAANEVVENYLSHFVARNWDLMAPSLADDFTADDRRRVVNTGVRHGRDSEIANVKAMAEVGCSHITTEPVAIRGDRLVLARHSFVAPEWPGLDTETVDVVEIDADNRIVAEIAYDANDLDAAIAELDARYLAGEAAAHARTWSEVAQAYARLNRRELPATTRDWINIDHRRLAPVESGYLAVFVRDAQDLWGDIYIEAVHRLSEVGAVVSRAVNATSHEGFDAEWREIDLLTFEGNRISRLELFDEADLDVALAKFEELSRPVPLLENAASRMTDRYLQLFTERDWDTLAAILADDFMATDRRRVVNAETRHGRDADIAVLRATAELGLTTYSSKVIATRGDRLALSRIYIYGEDEQPEAFRLEFLAVGEIDIDEKAAARVIFDPDDLDGALAELDVRYLAGEATAYAPTWSVVVAGFEMLNRHELPAVTSEYVIVDHQWQHATSEARGLVDQLQALWELTPDLRMHIESVHRLTELGTVITLAVRGTSIQGFDADWRITEVLTRDGDLGKRCEVFDEADLDAALARFDELSSPALRLQNAASRVAERFWMHFAANDRAVMSEIMAVDISIDDRRPVVNSGLRHAHGAVIDDMQIRADSGVTQTAPSVIATRGAHLVLGRIGYTAEDERTDPFVIEILYIIETDVADLVSTLVVFDPDDLDAAIAELDSRYLTGEAAAHARAWSLIAETFGAANRHELPPTTADWVNIDHRRVTTVEAGDLTESFNAAFDVVPDLKVYIETVHRLSDLGAVVTYTARGSSKEGFTAEWREIALMSIEGDKFSRNELFDAPDLESALARFDELSRPTPRLDNSASRLWKRLNTLFSSGDWSAMSQLVAQNMIDDDRRRTVNAGIRRGRDITIANGRAVAETGANKMASTVLAIRGESLALCHCSFFVRDQQPETFRIEFLSVIEIDPGGEVVGHVAFDPEDIDAAYAELDARYLLGEAAPFAQTYSTIADAFAAVNRHELPTTITPDFVSIDHRRPIAFAPGEMMAYLQATLNDAPDIRIDIETVHRLCDHGVVVSHVWRNTSQQGFDAEWRVITISTFEGGQINRCELYDETDLDAALARFDELSRPTAQLRNTASRVAGRFRECFANRDWSAMAELLADDLYNDDRRPVVNAGIRYGRESLLEDMRSAADIGIPRLMSTDVATRGERLVLVRAESPYDVRPDGYYVETLAIAEIDSHERVTAQVVFGADEIEAAYQELDARYIAGEAAPHASTWSVITQAYIGMTRGETPPTTTDLATIDHRQATAMAPDNGLAYLRASWDVAREFNLHIEAVHRLSDLGAVFTRSSTGTSHDGFDAEWRAIDVITVDGDKIRRGEIFDETDLDAALARFDELGRPTPQLENAASRLMMRFQEAFGARDWDGLTEIFADDICLHDRRRLVGATFVGRDATVANMRASAETGVKNVTSTVLATRADRLALQRVQIAGRDQRPEAFRTDAIVITEVDTHNQITAFIMFDLDEVDASYAELDVRYLAGEAAAYSRTWSVIKDGYAALNRHEIPPTTPDWVNVDHRGGGSTFAPGELATYVRSSWQDSPRNRIHVVTVHRLNDLGAVVTSTTCGVAVTGFYAEWREVGLVTVDGDLLSRTELFDEADLDAALAKFDELVRPAARSENAASRVIKRSGTYFAARNWEGMRADLAEEFTLDDRRRTVNGGKSHGRDSIIRDMRTAADVGFTDVTETVVALRGERLILTLARYSGSDEQREPFFAEVLHVSEIDDKGKIATTIVFDPDDYDAAFAELEYRYLAGEAADHAHSWTAISDAYAALNRRELPARTADWLSADHRRLATSALQSADMPEYISAGWDLTPDFRIYVEAVHRLGDAGAVVTHIATGTAQMGFDAEWRTIDVVTVEGDRLSRGEIFDEEDLDAALARFDELSRPAPQLGNAATGAFERLQACFGGRDWSVMGEILAEGMSAVDHRRVVNAGTRHGSAAAIASMQAAVGLGAERISSNVIATRGSRLALLRSRYSGRDRTPGAFHSEDLCVVEVDADGRITGHVTFDLDDIDAALVELDSRFIAGEAARHAEMWSVFAQGYATLNRHELPATSEWVTIDRRRVASFEAGDLSAYIRTGWDVAPDVKMYIAAVHRLSTRGAVVTHAAYGSSPAGFDAEWRMVALLLDDRPTNRCELFDESDLDAALAKFDELGRQVPRLENAATLIWTRLADAFHRRDEDAFFNLTDPDGQYDDRRKGLRVALDGSMRRRAVQTMFEFPQSWRMEIEPLAVRGSRLSLSRQIYRDFDVPDRPITLEVLTVTECSDDNHVHTFALFDPDDIDAAFAELDARYLAGEGAAHAQMWALVVDSYARFNRHEPPLTTTDWANIDHRRVTAFEPGDLTNYVQAAFTVTPDTQAHIAAVHRLSNLGAVITASTYGTSPQGFQAEWRDIHLLTFEGDLGNRFELFDDEDLDAALARFDELNWAAPLSENAATRVLARAVDAFNRRDLEGYLATYCDQGRYDDRRKGLRDNGPIKPKFASALVLDAGAGWQEDIECIAVRGSHLMLGHVAFRDHGEVDQPVAVEALLVAEITDDELISEFIIFDCDDIDAAFDELDARYLVGEAAAHSDTWSAIVNANEVFNRREMPPTTPDWVNVDRRRGGMAFAPGDQTEYIRATWDVASNITNHIVAVHRLSDLGAAFTQFVQATTPDGFNGEWRDVVILMIDGGMINRCEVFDEDDLDTAVSRFDELSAAATMLENAATRATAALADAFNRHEVDGLLATYGPDARYDDRRKGLRNVGLMSRDFGHGMFELEPTLDWRLHTEPIGIRGNRLALIRHTYRDTSEADRPIVVEALLLTEVDENSLIRHSVLLDPDDIDAAFAELTARWVASGDVTHPGVIESADQLVRAYNRHDWSSMEAAEAGAIYVNHRQLVGAEPETIGDHWSSIRALASLIPDMRIEGAEILAHSELGLVSNLVVKGTTAEGAPIELPTITLVLLDGESVVRVEAFDIDQRELALARFQEFNS